MTELILSFKKAKNGQFYFNIRSFHNGKIMAGTNDRYHNRSDCEASGLKVVGEDRITSGEVMLEYLW